MSNAVPGHSHGPIEAPSWRPSAQVRVWLGVALAPFALATLIGLVVLWPSGRPVPVPVQFTTFGEGRTVLESGTIIRVEQAPCDETGSTDTPVSVEGPICAVADVRIDDGPDAGRTVSIGDGSGRLEFSVGSDVRVARGPVTDPATGARSYEFADYERTLPLGLIAGAFALLLIGVARWRGLAALAGVGVAYLVLAKFLLPALLDGRSPVAVALVGCSAILFVVLYLAHGLSARTTTALLGTLGSLAVTAGIGVAVVSLAQLTGRSNDVYNQLLTNSLPVSIRGLILCGLIVGALGVLNDVTITQASAVWELSAADPDAGWRELFTGGMRIGRDHIASTVYTLVFAYAGAALPLLLLFSISGLGTGNLLTGDEIAGEIVRDAVGGAGLILSVPLTTLIAAVVAARPHEMVDDGWYDDEEDPDPDEPGAFSDPPVAAP